MRRIRVSAAVSAIAVLCLAGDLALPRSSTVQAAAIFNLQWDSSVPLAARPAIQAAADTWGSLLTSALPIDVAVSFTPFTIPPAPYTPRLTLSGPAGHVTIRDFFGAPLANTEYPEALAKALTGHEFYAGVPEMLIAINSNIDWYLGLDGNTGGKYDLRTAVLRDFVRGLGLSSTFTPFQSGPYPAGGWGTPSSPLPWVMDRFFANGSGQVLVDTFANHSVALRDQLTSNNIFFNGPIARAANGGSPPKLFARPYTEWFYVDDNSYLDETAFPAGTPNALITVRLDPGEVIHRPGAVVLAMLRDLGWTVGARVRAGADFDGDRRSDLAIFRPSTGVWHYRLSSVGAPIQSLWGAAGDRPVDGDFDGDGVNDVVVFRPSTGEWHIRGGASVPWGGSGDIPVPADYNGDRVTDIAIFRPSNGTWFVRGLAPVAWGGSGDIPVPGDYTGDGVAEFGVFRPSSGAWYVRGVFSLVWGGGDDIPVPADYDGDGVVDVAVYRPSSGTWYIRGAAPIVWGGAPGDIPVPGDYDGNGLADLAVFRPSTGVWYVRGIVAMVWGGNGDIPIARRP